MKTREKILLISLEMFNQLGEPQVSTVDIAAELDISPGNLYYHFRNKEEIVDGLFQRFEPLMNQTLNATQLSVISPVDGWLHLRCLFEIIWDYRFIYRDINHLARKNSHLTAAFRRLIHKKSDTIHFILTACQEADLFQLRPSEQQFLVESLLLAATSSLNFYIIRHEPIRKSNALGSFNLESILEQQKKPAETPEAVLYAIEQVSCLIMPYLRQEHRFLLAELLVENSSR